MIDVYYNYYYSLKPQTNHFIKKINNNRNKLDNSNTDISIIIILYFRYPFSLDYKIY